MSWLSDIIRAFIGTKPSRRPVPAPHRPVPQPQPKPQPRPNPQPAPPDPWTSADVVAALDAERARAGVATVLAGSPRLDLTAGTWAAYMARTGSLDHGNFGPRVIHAVPDANAEGETIAEGQPTVTAVVAAWMNSPLHRAIILDVRYRRAGVGWARDASGTMWWCCDFAN